MTKFSVRYSDLNDAYSLGRSLLNSKASAKSRALIFDATKGTVNFSVWTPSGIMRTGLEVTDSEVEEQWIFQVKHEDLSKILQPYSSLTVTKVTDVTFEKGDKNVIVSVSEEPIDGYSDDYAQTSHYSLGVIPIPGNAAEAVQEAFPEETEPLPALLFDEYIKALQPLLSNDSGGSNSSMFVVDEFVYVSTNAMFAAFKNNLPAALSGISFQYGTVSTLKLLAELALKRSSGASPEDLEDVALQLGSDVSEVDPRLLVNLDLGLITKEDGGLRYIAVRDGGTELLIAPQSTRLSAYAPFTEKIYAKGEEGYINRGVGFSVDRMYFQSVIKRLSFGGDEITFTFEGDSLSASTKGFSQKVPLTNSRGDLEDIAFNVKGVLISKLILGDDKKYAESSSDVFFYLIKEQRGYALYVLDGTDAWVTAINVSAARR